MLMAEKTSGAVNGVIEHCRVAPPSDAAAELLLPLTFYDLTCTNFYPVRFLFFYQFLHSKQHFKETLIPKLKESLSLTLKHFLPLAGSLINPALDSDGVPQLRYVTGDTLSVTFAESSEDFQDLVGDPAREACKFYSLIPRLPQGALFAVQVSVFPNQGIALGFAVQHVLGDFNDYMGFINMWASMNKFNGEEKLLFINNHKSLPFYGRELIKNPYKLDTTIYDLMKHWQSPSDDYILAHTKNFRATYVMSQSEIQKLKNFVLAKKPTLLHLSSFVLACAYIWMCWLKSLDACNTEQEKADENENEYFLCPMDCRGRLDPPLPANYFGNCVVPCIAKSTHGELVGPEGILVATEEIGMAIHKRVQDHEGILKGVWFYEAGQVNWQRALSVSDSTKQDTYDADFGWGKAEKFDMISNDVHAVISISKSRKHGCLEVGLSLPKNRLDSFTSIFTAELKDL